MIGFIGFAASAAALAGSIAGLGLSLRAVRLRQDLGLAVRVARFVFAAMLIANLAMVVALVSHDFSVAYVAQVGSRSTPLLYTLASLWGALEGSILFWGLLLTAATALLTVRLGGGDRALLGFALAVLFALIAFFAFIVVFPGDPWRRLSPAPLDGPGPNPLLQNHLLMAIHPPLLYVGFTFLAVPFALTVAALVLGRLDDAWLRLVRRWTLGPWIFLTLGLVAGAWWSYAVLGWGGYWAWDPVENVALLPWLTATAFLHSAMVQARRGGLLGWNVGLVVASFVLTILATLVTRSGILNSVHSFTQSVIGPLFLGLLAVTIVGSAALVALRLPDASRPNAPLGTRATAFLLNNVVFIALAATVLLGTLFPLFVEAATGAQVSVGAPYFERVIGPLAVGLLVLVGIGPSLPWGAWTSAARRRLLPGGLAAALGATVLALAGGPPELVAGTAAAGFALAQSIAYIAGRTRTLLRGRHLRASDRPTGRVRPSFGGLIVHAGVAVMALAIVAAGTGRRELSVTLRPGDTARLGPYALTLTSTRSDAQLDRSVVLADVAVTGPGGAFTIHPGLTAFARSTEALATPSISSAIDGDLYVTMTDLDLGLGAVTLRIALHPFISWLWIGGGIAALGGFIAAIPTSRGAKATRATEAHAIVAAPRIEPHGRALGAED